MTREISQNGETSGGGANDPLIEGVSDSANVGITLAVQNTSKRLGSNDRLTEKELEERLAKTIEPPDGGLCLCLS